MLGENSITVTSDPSLFQTEPSSNPMYPPYNSKFFWNFCKSNAPVDVTIFFSSTSIFFISAGTEPVEISIVLA